MTGQGYMSYGNPQRAVRIIGEIIINCDSEHGMACLLFFNGSIQPRTTRMCVGKVRILRGAIMI